MDELRPNPDLDELRRWAGIDKGRYWILSEHGEPTTVETLQEWAVWYETGENRILRQEDVGQFTVSTVYLSGPEFGDAGDGYMPSLGNVWETMIFARHASSDKVERTDYQRRCLTRESAWTMHGEAVDIAWASHVRNPNSNELIDEAEYVIDRDDSDPPVVHET